MIPVSRELSDLKGEFEGGSSLTIDWYTMLRRGSQNLLENIHPDTLKRTVPIYGGLTRGIQVYYCPTDVDVPARLWTYDRKTFFDYVPTADFYRHRHKQNRYTIEWSNGSRFIVVRHPVSISLVNIDPMDGTQAHTGTVALAKNTFNFLPGSAASEQGTFSDTEYEVDGALPAAVDISNLLYGVAIVPLYFQSAFDVDHVELDLLDANGNSWALSSEQDSIGDYFHDGQNMVRFQMQSAVQTSSPSTSITNYKLKVVMTSGKSQTVILGKITIQQMHLFMLDYISNQLFIDPTTGAWTNTPASGYNINLTEGACAILHYETALLVFQSAVIEKVNAPEEQRFTIQLERKYSNYYTEHPSEAQALSYNIRADIPHHVEPYYDGNFYDFGDQIGEDSNSELYQIPIVYFADQERPVGLIDGINTVYTLAHVPDPADSLEIVFNGNILTLGIDYNLNGNIITFTAAISAALVNSPFYANYRYLV